MSSKKTIKINPELFNFSGGAKTQKVRDRKQKQVKAQLVNPNAIKKQLLNRIKEHKNNENIAAHKPSSAVADKNKKQEDLLHLQLYFNFMVMSFSESIIHRNIWNTS